MKKIFYLFVFSIFLISCDINDPDDDFNKENIYTSFSIADTNGVEKTKFSQGENFILRFKIQNESGKELHFTHGYPIIFFTILNEDTIVASSTDYMLYIQPIDRGTVCNHDSFSEQWNGPNSFGRIMENQKIILEVGLYKALIYHGVFFDEYSIPQVNDIEFEVIE